MTFDDELKRAFETLTDRLRVEIDRQVQAAMDELSASARADKTAAVEAAVSSAPTVMNVPSPVAAAPPPSDGAGAEKLLDSIRALDEARSLTGILDALIAASARDGAGAGVWLVRGGSLRHWRSSGIDRPDADVPLDAPRALADAARTNATAWDDGLAVPLALAGQTVAVLYASASRSPGPQFPGPHAIELLARHAAKCLESVTAFKTARALTDRADAAQPGGSDEAEEHVSALRYARLLVSEIKLYHEAAVIEGRRDRDLATRLGGEIARARVMYEQRVPPHVRQRADHFHDELVRTLADGDASLLEVKTQKFEV
jgi:hypothetical protein